MKILFLAVLLVANLSKNGNYAKCAGSERDAKTVGSNHKLLFPAVLLGANRTRKIFKKQDYKKTAEICKNLVLQTLLLNFSYIYLFLFKNYLKTT